MEVVHACVVDLCDEQPFRKRPVQVLSLELVHPDEEPAGEEPDALHKILRQAPIDTPQGLVVPRLANIAAYKLPPDEYGKRRRFKDRNLVQAHNTQLKTDGPDDNNISENILMSALGYAFAQSDLVVDWHGNRTPGYDWAFCHPGANRHVWRMIGLLGIKHVVHHAPPHWAGRYKNYLGLDLSSDSPLKAAKRREILQRFIEEPEQPNFS